MSQAAVSQAQTTDQGQTGVIKRKYGITGDQEQNAGNAVWKDRPKTASDFLNSIDGFVSEAELGNFFSGPNRRFLQTVAEKAVDLLKDTENPLSSPQNVKKLIPVNLFQVVIYCDDSLSMMGDGRAKAQAALVERIARISTRLVPDGVGVELRFINASDGELSGLDAAGVQRRMEALRITPGSYTQIGVGFRDRILQPLVYDTIEGQGALARPVLVCIVTDGSPQNPPHKPPGRRKENFNTTRDFMVECAGRLEKKGYPTTSVRFLLNQIGNDEKAGKFLTNLASEGRLKDVMHVTAEKLDDVWKEKRDNQRDLEEWLLTNLLSGITERGVWRAGYV